MRRGKRRKIVRDHLLGHLREAYESLHQLIQGIEEDPKFFLDDSVLEIEFSHIYHHLNTAWNGRYLTYEEASSDGMFYRLRQFPQDIDMGPPLLDEEE